MSKCRALADAEPRRDRIHRSAFIPPAHGWLKRREDRMDGKISSFRRERETLFIEAAHQYSSLQTHIMSESL